MVVRQDDQLSILELRDEEFCQPTAVFDVEAIDDIIEDNRLELLIEDLGHCQEEGNCQRIEVRFAEDTVRGALMSAVEVHRKLESLLGPRLNCNSNETFVWMQCLIERADPVRDRPEDLSVSMCFQLFTGGVNAIGPSERDRARLGDFNAGLPGASLFAEGSETHE